MMNTDSWTKGTLDLVRSYLNEAKSIVRVATGYFTVQGYDRIRPFLQDKQVRIMVGYDEFAREQQQTRLIASILDDLATWDMANRRVVVLDLLRRLRLGQLNIVEQAPASTVDIRTRQRDHAKVFIMDDRFALIGSMNLTYNGLISNIEAATVVDNPERVHYWLVKFDEYWNAPDTEDVTAELIRALEAWLKLRPPFEIYLKTLLALGTPLEVNPPREAYKMPTYYQLVVVERVLRQFHMYRGAMLVASTGLGKTVMATHAAWRLMHERKIRNVIVFAPLQVHPNWQQDMFNAGIACQVYSRDLLDQPRRKNTRQAKLRDMEVALSKVDEQYLIIVDESQRFRHRLRANGSIRQSFQRLQDVVAIKKPIVLLLTATPYARDVADVNNQLSLLPHTAQPDHRTMSGQFVIPGLLDDINPPRAWRVPQSEDFFQAFLELPVATIISTSQVARDFAQTTDEGDFVVFKVGPRWIPQIGTYKQYVEPLAEELMSPVLTDGIFKHAPIRYRSRDRGGTTQVNIQRMAELSWVSSPIALGEVIQKTIDEQYQVKFITEQTIRRRRLQPIVDWLERLSPDQDDKLMKLCLLVREAAKQDQKVLIFSEYHATAVYLCEQLALQFPNLAVATTSKRTGDNNYGLVDFNREAFDLILAFAPEANADTLRQGQIKKNIDILIVTDAFSAGVNLQDAEIVVHYDLAWTPDVLTQRAGRILRFWKKPRRVRFYLYLHKFQSKNTLAVDTLLAERRLGQLILRDNEARRFTALPSVLDAESGEFISLSEFSEVHGEYWGDADIGRLSEFDAISPLLRHTATLRKYEEWAQTIPNDIAGAMEYDGKTPELYLLLKYQDRYEWCVLDLANDHFVEYSEDQLLELIHCTPETPVALVSEDDIEKASQYCRSLWIAQSGVADADQWQRVCALYLQPKGVQANISNILPT